MSASFLVQLIVHLVLGGHQEVQEPVFLLVHKAKVTAGALIAGEHGFLIEVIAH